MELRFSRRPDGIIDASLGPDHAMLNHALEDAVSSRAPRGAPRPGLSTYWIDQAEVRARSAAAEGSREPFASGNVTYLRLDGDRVVAGYDFDPAEAETDSISLEEFLRLLAAWRTEVVDAGGATGKDAIPPVDPRPMGPAS
jgi:hypothetical protein